jgi:hypothetical protein
MFFSKEKKKRKIEKNIGPCLLPKCGRKCINCHLMFFFSMTEKEEFLLKKPFGSYLMIFFTNVGGINWPLDVSP